MKGGYVIIEFPESIYSALEGVAVPGLSKKAEKAIRAGKPIMVQCGSSQFWAIGKANYSYNALVSYTFKAIYTIDDVIGYGAFTVTVSDIATYQYGTFEGGGGSSKRIPIIGFGATPTIGPDNVVFTLSDADYEILKSGDAWVSVNFENGGEDYIFNFTFLAHYGRSEGGVVRIVAGETSPAFVSGLYVFYSFIFDEETKKIIVLVTKVAD